MKPCPKWSQSRTSSSTSLFCRSEDVTETAEKVHLRPRFQSACPVFSGQCPFQRSTQLQLLSEAIPKLQHHPKTTTSLLDTLSLTCFCVKQQPAAYCSWSHPVSRWESLQCCKLGYVWNILCTLHVSTSTSQTNRRWSYLYKGILFILFILKNYSVYSVLLLFVSIEILHVHVSVNTFWFCQIQKVDITICFCFYSIFSVQPVCGQSKWGIYLLLFQYISSFCYLHQAVMY